jgi:hypothetical protein
LARQATTRRALFCIEPAAYWLRGFGAGIVNQLNALSPERIRVSIPLLLVATTLIDTAMKTELIVCKDLVNRLRCAPQRCVTITTLTAILPSLVEKSKRH